MQLERETDSEVVRKIEALRGEERRTVLELLKWLGEFDARRLYAPLGYGSTFDYLTRKLRYSESSAGRRVSACRCLREHPELGISYLEGRTTLLNIAQAAKAIREGEIEPEAISSKSTREVAIMVGKERETKPREVVKPVVVSVPPLPLFQNPPPKEERYEIRFSVSKEEYEAITRVKERMSHRLGRELTFEGVFCTLTKEFLKERRSRHSKVEPYGRFIPASTKREVFKRDKGQCTFCAPDGTRCTSRTFLEFDHIRPISLGGESTLENLRLLCRVHNQHEARRVLGDNVMQRFLS